MYQPMNKHNQPSGAMVAQQTSNLKVVGSSPTLVATFFHKYIRLTTYFTIVFKHFEANKQLIVLSTILDILFHTKYS